MISSAFERITPLVNLEGMEKLTHAHIAVFGLGGVGSFATEALVRSGIGNLTLVDFDEVKPSNINRQIYALYSTIGHKKVDLAIKRAKDINPSIKIDSQTIYWAQENADTIFQTNFDYVIDAIDSVAPKVLLIHKAITNNIPVISSMGAAGRLNPAHVRCTDLFEVKGCTLSKHIRKRLRKQGINTGVKAVWSDEYFSISSYENIAKEKERATLGREKAPLPSMMFVPSVFGITIAYHVVNDILNS